jgi:hypothetical protein
MSDGEPDRTDIDALRRHLERLLWDEVELLVGGLQQIERDARIRFAALGELLIEKGIVTGDEIDAMERALRADLAEGTARHAERHVTDFARLRDEIRRTLAETGPEGEEPAGR